MSRDDRAERSIEAAGERLLARLGFKTVKLGSEGWPDRLVFTAPGRHEFVEWKRPGGRLTPAQRRRIPRLRAAGEVVHVLESEQDLAWWANEWLIQRALAKTVSP